MEIINRCVKEVSEIDMLSSMIIRGYLLGVYAMMMGYNKEKMNEDIMIMTGKDFKL